MDKANLDNEDFIIFDGNETITIKITNVMKLKDILNEIKKKRDIESLRHYEKN